MPIERVLKTELAVSPSSRYLVSIIMIEWHTNIREEGLNLLDALVLRVPSAPRGFLRQILKKKRVRINGQPACAETPVQCGERVTVSESKRFLEILNNSPLAPRQILHEDTQCLIINKPAGLAIHRGQGHNNNLLDRVKSYLHLRGETFRVAPIHRLDIGTSGVVLIGKGKEAISQLGKAIMAGEMTKRYLALVQGRVPAHGVLDSPVSAKGRLKGALTRYHRVAEAGNHSLLRLELDTGRRHQIRQQLSAISHPIIGDTRYGARPIEGVNHAMLHSQQLQLSNPVTGQAINVLCSPTETFLSLAVQLGFDASTLQNLFTEK